MKPRDMYVGTVVRHYASGILMTVEAVAEETVRCTWFMGAALCRGEFASGDLKIWRI